MRAPARIVRPNREAPNARRTSRATAATRILERAALAAPKREVVSRGSPAVSRAVSRLPVLELQPHPDLPEINLQPDPFADYARALTPEGGVLIQFKTYDLRLRHTLWRLLAWSVSTGTDALLLSQGPQLHSSAITIGILVMAAIANWLIVAKRVEVACSVEIRPDCLILDGSDIFWTVHMNDSPRMMPLDMNGGLALQGIYGTRQVEFLTVYRFDENDRTPERLRQDLTEAMAQLWTRTA